MTKNFKTAGEAFVGRELKGDGRHFTPGQMSAKYVCDEEALFAFLTWVNSMGHVVAMLVCKKKDGDWEPALGTYREAGQGVVYPEKKLADDYELKDGTKRFLNEAEASWR